MDGSWDVYLGSPTDFFGGTDDITKGERAWDRDNRMHSPIFDYYWLSGWSTCDMISNYAWLLLDFHFW